MILFDKSYSEFTGAKTADYPGGCAVDASTDEGFDGTEYKARWHNDVIGAFHSVFVAAFGDINKVTNRPDNVNDSDFLRALQQLMHVQADAARLLTDVTGAEIVLTWDELNIYWTAEKHFAAFANFAGKFANYLPIKAWAEDDGVHLWIRRYNENGNIVEGTPAQRWNTLKWGAFKWGQNDFVPVNIIVKEVFE